jgi:serine phosphatase RsbU (regulator of sigma subunit)
LGYPEDYSAIAAPLRIGDQLLGVLSLAHRSAGRYGSEAQAMTAAFASYAAVAIENARLYEDAHEQAWISTVLLQVAEATQAVEDLPELLDTVIRITPMLTGVEACLLYILDEDGTFLPAASTGLTPAQQTEFERWRFAPGDVAALDRLAEVREPVILRGDEEEDRRLTSILAVGAEEGEVKDIGFPVLVPLLARGEVLGAFLVEYSPNLPTLSLGKSFEAFFDERLAILQGIAHQTAVAADNIRLLKAQKEEAYVSVALLQVAQAVVSSNELDEALGSIVRITPILVGVKRAMIYLWDEALNLFRTSQAYGLPRSAEGRVFPRGTFPLLDALLLEDALVAYPVQDDEESADPPEAWTRLVAPDQDTVARFLEEEACLLMAFPLSVKGKVLGAFLVEEPDPVPGETYSSSGVGAGAAANRRLRSKRIEIITGISHQAALAIQNDLLQQETVERERLEREMQLAREIQTAFLPQQLPELPGWDLQVYWRPAREVGGDFYDFFDLPGDRLGLVIADVADKGMPAALFMTLVRTLVRATVQVLDSPAKVVERVNDLLVPDATRGMFVTLVYAVLDLKTGRLKAANAGHNPPLLLHRPCRFERLGRGGMALGVEAGARTQSHSYTLEPGELLVMYTDGVTEAFSPEGEMFGEGRLLTAIEETVRCDRSLAQTEKLSARVLLDAIDHEVIDFIGDTVPYDDLTLVVLKRADN